jgi:hypothetical protein
VLDAQQHRRIAEDQRGSSRVARPKMPVYPGGAITGEPGSRSAQENSRPVARSGPFQLSATPLGRWSCPQAASVSRRPSRPAVVFPLKLCLARRSHARPARRAGSDGGSVRGLLRVRRRPDFRNAGVQRGHPLKGLAGHTVPLQIAEIGDLVDEDVGIVSEADQVISDSGHPRTLPSRPGASSRELSGRPARTPNKPGCGWLLSASKVKLSL